MGKAVHHLIFMNLLEFLLLRYKLLQRMNLTFGYFYCSVELFIVKFILKFNTEHARNYSCAEATLPFCSYRENLPRQGGLSGAEQRIARLSKLPQGNEKLT